jgi:hypothetical protein
VERCTALYVSSVLVMRRTHASSSLIALLSQLYIASEARVAPYDPEIDAGASPVHSRAFASGLHRGDYGTALGLLMLDYMQRSAILEGSPVSACDNRPPLCSRLVRDLLHHPISVPEGAAPALLVATTGRCRAQYRRQVTAPCIS